MQVLGKKSKVLLIAVAIAMLVALGVSFASWDNMSTAQATNGDLSTYANAKIGDVITFGKYYQTGNKVSDTEDAEYEKTPIEWLVVDKDERTGQLTLMSKYILAAGSYFGNHYFSNANNTLGAYYDNNKSVADIPYNQAYVDSTVRAYLNNLERLDIGGDSFDNIKGYLPSNINSSNDISIDGNFSKGTGLLSSVGFSNQRHWTKLSNTDGNMATLLADPKNGLAERFDLKSEVYYKRPITNEEYKNRPATRGFLDEAFNDIEKSMIVPKAIAGFTGHRWPDNEFDVATKSYIEGALDKVWLPSATELNIANATDWNGDIDDAWTNPSDKTGSNVFEYFKNYQNYGHSSVADAVKAIRTPFAKNSFAMNYSIPVYQKGTTEINTDISSSLNSSDHYWTRSPSSFWFFSMRTVYSNGTFHAWRSCYSYVGVRPCIILKY